MNVQVLANADPPLAAAHPATWKLLRARAVYGGDGQWTTLFGTAMGENALWHFERNSHYRKICANVGFRPERDLTSAADVDRIPTISSGLLKERELTTEIEGRCLRVSSSGTGGVRTTVPLDQETIIRMWAMGRATFEEADLVAEDPVHYIIFAPRPEAAAGQGNALFFASIMEFSPAIDIVYAVEPRPGGLRLARDAIETKLAECTRTGRPVRFVGLPALMAEVARSSSASLAANSLVITGGGWKDQQQHAMSKADFKTLVSGAWGVPRTRVRDLYGMTEHAVHYLDCSQNRFHAPVFSRVDIVDPLTLDPVPFGQEGLLRLMNPGFTTLPVLSLLTSDVARAVASCPCGRETMAFEVLRRADDGPFRGCAATTLDAIRP